MSKTLKQIIYSVYKSNKNDEFMTEDKMFNVVNSLTEATREEFDKNISEIKDLEALFELDSSWAFGTELEFGGRSNRLSYDSDNNEELIETIKNDCSVSGDGTEYNLKPIYFKDLDNKKTKLESLCYRMANKNCLIVPSAGEHFHYSWDKISPFMGCIVQEFMGNYTSNDVRMYPDFKEDDISLKFGHKDSYGTWYYTPKIRMMSVGYAHNRNRVEDALKLFELNKDESNKESYDKSVAVYRLLQCLYTTSNRSGYESYGLGSDGTRGYTRHGTIELRCWRTTTDYRSIIARAHFGRFILREMLRYGIMEQRGFISYEEENIWNELRKDPYILDCFRYLAFHVNNSHKCGCGVDDIETLTSTGHKYGIAIKQRTKMIQASLVGTNPESKAKELFKLI